MGDRIREIGFESDERAVRALRDIRLTALNIRPPTQLATRTHTIERLRPRSKRNEQHTRDGED